MRPTGLKIVSGGQTGADRAALDWAIRNKIPHGGWCPKGRKAEDGVIAGHYKLQETPTARYVQRTDWNVRDSDGTVIFSIAAQLTGGPRKTLELARKNRRPFLLLAKSMLGKHPALQLQDFIEQHHVQILNVAGPRASRAPDIGEFVTTVLEDWRITETLRRQMRGAKRRL